MPKQIAIIGIGGMGREVIDVVEALRDAGEDIEIAGVIDDRPESVNLERLRARGYEYLGTSEDALASARPDGYVIGIGTPAVRRLLAERFESAGWTPVSVVHPHATVGSESRLEPGVVVCAGARITTNVAIERHVLVNLNVTIGHDTRVGAYSVANPGAQISGDVTIETGVLIGTGAVVLQGLFVNTDSTIGANACVTKNVSGRTTVVGVPAKALGTAAK